MKTQDLVKASLFAIVIALCSQISIPIPLIPLTLQVFAISLSAQVLPRKQAMLAVTLYTILGLIGLPVFAGGRGGLSILTSPTFGFVLGFFTMTFSMSSIKKAPLSLVIGYLSLYIVAVPYLAVYLKLNGANTGLIQVIQLFWLKFLPTDAISIGLSYFVAKRLRKLLPNQIKQPIAQ